MPLAAAQSTKEARQGADARGNRETHAGGQLPRTRTPAIPPRTRYRLLLLGAATYSEFHLLFEGRRIPSGQSPTYEIKMGLESRPAPWWPGGCTARMRQSSGSVF